LNSHETQPTHVLTLTLGPGLPIRVLDQILTATEESLTEAGATRVWAERSPSGMVVMADLPTGADEQRSDWAAHGCGAEVPVAG
jgi:hypothetical protein